MIEMRIWGGAGEEGRSCYFVKQGDSRILFDCGVKKEGKGEYPLLDREEVAQLDAVFLSHAHEDHTMAIPLLYRLGYRGDVYTTRPTVEQLPAYVTAWNSFVHHRSGVLPFDEQDRMRVTYQIVENIAKPLEWYDLSTNIQFAWGRSGHMAGSVWWVVCLEGKVVFFSGDYTAESSLFVHDAPSLSKLNLSSVDLAIVDAAYGVDKESQKNYMDRMMLSMEESLGQAGTVLLPVPVYGRGQELLMMLKEAFPHVRFIVESSIVKALASYMEWHDWLKPEVLEPVAKMLAGDSNMNIIHTQSDRDQLLFEDAQIIFTSDGMMQDKVSQTYYRRIQQDPVNRVIFTGHLARGSFGRELLNHQNDSECQVEWIRYKVHQGIDDVHIMLNQLHARQTIPVHANKHKIDEMITLLRDKGHNGLLSLRPGDIQIFP